jgi:small subunit ribosomal protein S3
MGQKVNPIGLRLGINRTWESRWYANSAEYGDLLHEDIAMRAYIMKELKNASVSRVIIERPHKKCRITIYTARPGVVIGKKGGDIEKLRLKLSEMVEGEVFLNLVEVRKPEVDANIVADGIAQQLERRVSYRRAMKRSLQSAMRMGAIGCKMKLGGRLGGVEIARVEQYQEGSVPLHTLRADIDYGTARAMTAMGIIGIKVWINKGEIMEHDPYAHEKRLNTQDSNRGGDRGPRPARAN